MPSKITQKLYLFCENFKLEGNKVSGVAIHPKRIFHPEEDIIHVYLRGELQKAAHTGAGKPFGIDHSYLLDVPNRLTKSWYCKDEDGICFEGLVDDQIASQIRNKVFKGISIELNWLRPGGSVEFVNGVAAKNFELTSVHFLKQFPPGDPDAYVKLWEQVTTTIHGRSKEQAIRYGVTRTEECILDGIEAGLSNEDIANNCGTYPSIVELVRSNYGYLSKKLAGIKSELRAKEQLVVGPPQPLDQRVEALEQQVQELLNKIDVINGKLEVLTGTSSPSATVQPAQTGASQTTGVIKMKEAEWDTEYINNLPDSAFAHIEAGGEKDEEGKTTPRNLRHLPFKNAQGNIDHDHLVNALGRLPQTEISDEAKADAKKKLCAAVNSWNSDHDDKIESEVCGTTTATGESLKVRNALIKKYKEQGQADPEKCVRDMLAAGMADLDIMHICGVDSGDIDRIRKELGEAKKLKEQVPWLTATQQACIEAGIDAGKSGAEIAEECSIPLEALTGILMLKEQGNQEPEKDVHGCLIGKERYDEENKKCVPIIAEARVAFLEAKLMLKEQEGELTIEQIKAKIAELAKRREELDKKLWPEVPESGLSEEEKAAVRTQIDVLYAEIDAYEQALKAKIAAQAVPPGTPSEEAELKKVKENVVALRKLVVQAEAKVLDIEKTMKREAGSWKEKFETLRESVKGAIPPPRIWKSWTPGPQRYVQENLKILRESAS